MATRRDLYEELRILRVKLARENGLQDYMVFSNDTLREMALKRPGTRDEMLSIRGVGPAKMDRYGPDFLQVIHEWVGMNAAPQDTNQSTDTAQRKIRDSRNAGSTGRYDGGTQSAQQPIPNHQVADPRNRYPADYRTSDGHYVRSRAEAMIDDWLFNRHIAHAYERKLPVEEDALCDFYLPQGNVYIEFWGKEDDAAYVRRMEEKREIYRRNSLKLISLTDSELYRLDDHMPGLLRRHGVGVN